VEKVRLQLVEAHKMAALGRLTAGIVHEINTPIASILSNNEVILRSLENLKSAAGRSLEASSAPPAKVTEILETIHSLSSVDKIACERISAVVRGLKTFSRVDEADLRKVDLHEGLRSTLKLTECQFRHRIPVETDFGELPEVECYPHLLNQVFLNVIINAGQSIDGEGKIAVRTRLDGDSAHVSISDTGRGIKPKDRPKIFAPGFTTKAVGVGSGLGLSISKRIVEETHGGTIDFESEPGVGTKFHIRIPVRQQRESTR
jgi:signal transduction histidine kinase